MLVLNIHEKSLKIVYKTTLLSKTTFFVVVTSVVSMIFPFIFAYRSRGFWLKHDTFYEQPAVNYRGEFFFVGITDNISNVIICNNFNYVQEFNVYDTCSTIKAREIDANFDKKIDAFNFQLELNLPENEQLIHFTILLTLDYRLQTVCPLIMQSAVLVQQNLLNSVNEFHISGNLKLVQSVPLECKNLVKDRNFNQSVISGNLQDYNNYNLENLIRRYSNRNMSTDLGEVYIWFKVNNNKKFKLDLNLKYPDHKIYYQTGFWQVIKWAWIQYLAIYIIFAWVLRKIYNYVFDNRLLLFYTHCPLNKRD